MSEENYIFVNLRFVINETIDKNTYRILQHLTEWPMVVSEKPEIFENDFFRNEDWSDFFARNGTVTLGNFMAYEEMGIQKVFTINSYVPYNRKNTVFYFIKWLTGMLGAAVSENDGQPGGFEPQEFMLGYIDNGDSSFEIITGKRAQPIDFKALENQ